jgi:hypothetical protein
MTAAKPSARGKKPRNGNTAKMLDLIRSSKAGVTSPELAAHVGILVKQVAPLLHDYKMRGELVTCIVQRPGQRDCTLYRDGSGRTGVDQRPGWKGQAFPLASERKLRGKSLTAADIPGATPPAAPLFPMPVINTGGGDIATADPSAADSAHDQPEVSSNAGSAGDAMPLGVGLRRRPPASSTRAPKPVAEEAGAIRWTMDAAGVLTIDSDLHGAPLVMPRELVCDFASFLAGTRPIWSART